jgi:hypothetical protein
MWMGYRAFKLALATEGAVWKERSLLICTVHDDNFATLTIERRR